MASAYGFAPRLLAVMTAAQALRVLAAELVASVAQAEDVVNIDRRLGAAGKLAYRVFTQTEVPKISPSPTPIERFVLWVAVLLVPLTAGC